MSMVRPEKDDTGTRGLCESTNIKEHHQSPPSLYYERESHSTLQAQPRTSQCLSSLLWHLLLQLMRWLSTKPHF